MLFRRKITQLGIDIGTASIKIAEIEKAGGSNVLSNYAIYSPPVFEEKLISLESSSPAFFEKEISEVLKMMLEKAKIKTRKAVFSLPAFSSFFTEIELPPLTKEEIPSAVEFQAAQYVPMPLSEVTLEWHIIGEEEEKPKDIWHKPIVPGKEEPKPIRVLLVAVPSAVIERYVRLAQSLKLEILALEVESFSLARALIDKKTQKSPYLILDIGGTSSSLFIIDSGMVRVSHHLDLSSYKIVTELSERLKITIPRAYFLHLEKNVAQTGSLAKLVLFPILDKIRFEVEQTMNAFAIQNPQKKIEKIILCGGGSYIGQVQDYLSTKIGIPVEISNPFQKIQYPKILEPRLKEIGPRLSVAIGLALFGI
jgi:type IV pilus assembly protein PilM